MSDRIEKLKQYREKIKTESAGKLAARRHIDYCYVPMVYLLYGVTKRDLFKKRIKIELDRVNKSYTK